MSVRYVHYQRCCMYRSWETKGAHTEGRRTGTTRTLVTAHDEMGWDWTKPEMMVEKSPAQPVGKA